MIATIARSRTRSRRVLIALFSALAVGPVGAESYFVDSDRGNDLNTGRTPRAAWRTLAHLNLQTLSPGDKILLKRDCVWEEELDLTASGTTAEPLSVGSYGEGTARPMVRSLKVSGDDCIVEDLIIDHGKGAEPAVRVRGSRGCILRRIEVRNGIDNGIDIDHATDLLIEHSQVHHFLAGSYLDQQMAHGIVASRVHGLVVRGTEVHQVSGDCFHADPERDPSLRTDEILIENCHFWTGPLTEEFSSGWVRTDQLPVALHQCPGESAIDTKAARGGVEAGPRMRWVLRNLRIHGWRGGRGLSPRSALHLKEDVDVVADGLTIDDCQIALRLGGGDGLPGVSLRNCVIYDCSEAIRSEDSLAYLRVYNSTFGRGIQKPLERRNELLTAGDWEFRNNVFLNEKPSVAQEPTNVVIAPNEINSAFVAADAGDYRPCSGSPLIDRGEPLERVRQDRDGRERAGPVDVGAYESPNAAAK